MQDKKIDFTRVPVGGGGLVPNLLAGNVDAAVVYSPLSFQISKSGEARTILDYSKEVPPNLAAGWIVLDKYAQEKPQLVQKTLNALYGALMFMRANKDASVKLIAELYEIPAEIAALEYENTIMKLETDGSMDGREDSGAASARARHGQGRRHEGSWRRRPRSSRRSSSRFRPSPEAAAMRGARRKGGADRHRGGAVRDMGNPVADRHRQSAAASLRLRHAGDARRTAAARERAQGSRRDRNRGA